MAFAPSPRRKFAILTTLLATGAAHKSGLRHQHQHDEFGHQVAFKKFMNDHGKVYQTQDEHSTRFAVFKKNLSETRRLNAALRRKGKDEIHGVTKFFDMEREEVRVREEGGGRED